MEKVDLTQELAVSEKLHLSTAVKAVDGIIRILNEALASQWKDPKVELPEDGETVLIREHYRSAKSGRFVVHFIEFTYFSEHGFALEEGRHRTLGLRVTHWMRIPPINKV